MPEAQSLAVDGIKQAEKLIENNRKQEEKYD